SLLSDHREARLCAFGVLYHAVPVAILETDALEQLARGIVVVRISLEIGPEPRLIAGRNRAPHGYSCAEKHGLRECFPIDRVRDRLPELRPLYEGESRIVLLRFRLQAEP